MTATLTKLILPRTIRW